MNKSELNKEISKGDMAYEDARFYDLTRVPNIKVVITARDNQDVEYGDIDYVFILSDRIFMSACGEQFFFGNYKEYKFVQGEGNE